MINLFTGILPNCGNRLLSGRKEILPRVSNQLNKKNTPAIGPWWLVILLILAFLCYPLIVFSDQALGDSSTPEPESKLDRIVASGTLRVLLHSRDGQAANVSDIEKTLLARFAESHQVVLKWVEVDARWNLLQRLLDGEGDIIVGEGKSLLAGVSGPIEFTVPWTSSHLQIVARADTTQINKPSDLAFRQVAVKKSAPSWPILQDLAESNPNMEILAVPESLSREEILQRVSSAMYDLTVADSQFLAGYLPQHTELTAVYDLTEGKPRAWGVPASAENLQAALNQFLYKNHLSLSVGDVHLGDLPSMQARRTLRVITYQNPAHYYFSDGKFHGFEYDLISSFASKENMRVDVVLADSHAEMQSLLLRGEGDIIAASLPAGSIGDDDIAVSDAYNYSTPVIVGRDNNTPITDIRDLEGRRVTLPASSPYRHYLESIRSRGVDFEIAKADSSISIKGVLSMVSLGMYDLTLLDNQQLKPELIEEYDVQPQFTLGEPIPHVWAVRTENTQLLASVNEYLKSSYRNKFYNVLYARYFERGNHHIADTRLVPEATSLSPYDEIVRHYAEHYSFDWRLIVAQMYQESQFNPAAVSYAGARGLMQLMPATAELVGNKNTSDPEMNIASGVKYLSMLRDRFEKDLLLEDRTWFTLASYNAGYGRVKRARELAEEMGLDKNRWFGNVEKAMLMLAKPFEREGEMIRHCRCGQAVVYVREIRTLYNNYVRLTQATQIAGRDLIKKAPYDI